MRCVALRRDTESRYLMMETTRKADGRIVNVVERRNESRDKTHLQQPMLQFYSKSQCLSHVFSQSRITQIH